MASTGLVSHPNSERQWFILGRWQEYDGEGRANLLRLIGLTIYYAVELIRYHGLDPEPKVLERPFHLSITFLTVAWFMLAVGVFYCRTNGIFPSWLKYLSTGCDLLLLTTVLSLADGPRSPLVVVYFLVVALAGLRFSLRLIWFATAGAAAGYLFLLAFARWGPALPWQPGNATVPRYHQVIFVVSLVLAGVILGQVIRRVRRLVEQYAQRVAEAGGGQP